MVFGAIWQLKKQKKEEIVELKRTQVILKRQ